MRISNGVQEKVYTPKTIELKSMDAPKANEDIVSTTIKNSEMQNTKADKPVEDDQEDSERKIIQAIEKSNKHIKIYNRRLEFSIHDATKQIMVKVIDTEDGSVIREIPSEKILDMVAHLWEVAGILVDEKR